MPFQKGNKLGGTKSKAQMFKDESERVAKLTIEELATSKVYECLGTIKAKTDKQGVKDIAMPVYLKSKADKVDLTGNVMLNFDDSFNTTSKTESDSEEQS